jgi:hypothetical protein
MVLMVVAGLTSQHKKTTFAMTTGSRATS